MPLIKVAYLMLNFLNLKSKPIHLFFWVASSLSMVWADDVADAADAAEALGLWILLMFGDQFLI